MTIYSDEKIASLLEEYKENRDSIKKMIDDANALSKKIDSLFPSKLEIRYSRLFEEKVKACTELFRVILDMRQELSKSLKNEIEIRYKVRSDESDEEYDISRIAQEVERLQRSKKKLNITQLKKINKEKNVGCSIR